MKIEKSNPCAKMSHQFEIFFVCLQSSKHTFKSKVLCKCIALYHRIELTWNLIAIFMEKSLMINSSSLCDRENLLAALPLQCLGV